MQAEGEHPPIVFKGKGMRLSEEEKNSWHPSVQVYFQKKCLG